jgi:uncharacterized membrane protein YccF (DUF307 family)
MSLLGNILWILCGGFIISIEYILGGVLLFITIIGIPFGFQCFKLAVLAMMPFGRRLESKPVTSGFIKTVLNIAWLCSFGLIISISHLICALLLALTIIGLPFAKQHAKLATLALTPFGKMIY